MARDGQPASQLSPAQKPFSLAFSSRLVIHPATWLLHIFFLGHFWDLFQVCTVIVYSVVLYSKLETSPTPYTPNKHLIAPPLCPEGQPS